MTVPVRSSWNCPGREWTLISPQWPSLPGTITANSNPISIGTRLGTVPIFAGTAAKPWSTKMGLSPFGRVWIVLTQKRLRAPRLSFGRRRPRRAWAWRSNVGRRRGHPTDHRGGIGQRRQAAAPVDADAFRQGMWVLHGTYGLGQIIALSGSASSRQATIDFPPPTGARECLGPGFATASRT